MRVLEQYPVQLTFFFVPQVVQALRSDALGECASVPRGLSAAFARADDGPPFGAFPAGYVERFVFETSKVSQLFCHQIIWNMKANTHRDDGATEVRFARPQLPSV